MTVEILKPPANIPGQGMTEFSKDLLRVARSTDVTLTSDLTTVTIFRVPANTFVAGAFVEVVTALDGTLFTSDIGIDIGDSDNADALGRLECATTMTAGYTYSGALSKNYTSAQDLLITSSTLDAITAGAVRVWLTFKTESDVQEVKNS